MSTGADNKTMPITPEYADGYDRIFGKAHAPQRGQFIWDKALHKFVPASEYAASEPEKALDAPIMAGRFYENTFAPDSDKTDIGSRKRHREYMKERGLTNPSDYTETWAKQEEERKRIRAGEPARDTERREQIGRAAYEVEKKHARRR